MTQVLLFEWVVKGGQSHMGYSILASLGTGIDWDGEQVADLVG